MKIVYIAHPIGRDQWQKSINLGNIKRIVREINLSQRDIVPFVPYYCDCEALRDDVDKERAKGLKNGQTLLKTCPIHELWLYGDKISEGMQEEIKTAFILGIPVIPKTWQTQEAYQELYYKEIQGKF